jgi:hypothetical protein
VPFRDKEIKKSFANISYAKLGCAHGYEKGKEMGKIWGYCAIIGFEKAKLFKLQLLPFDKANLNASSKN